MAGLSTGNGSIITGPGPWAPHPGSSKGLWGTTSLGLGGSAGILLSALELEEAEETEDLDEGCGGFMRAVRGRKVCFGESAELMMNRY